MAGDGSADPAPAQREARRSFERRAFSRVPAATCVSGATAPSPVDNHPEYDRYQDRDGDGVVCER
ncbi:excalibur calcium-binding domain-containing protein [Streptosporangium sp. NPDC006007]|uniref:excalibur calcium-binding domain-containing protein n=1 Tax=Streptosporangium sp. NPDC006007 TaxID=3154575 RepID=UPI0033B28702